MKDKTILIGCNSLDYILFQKILEADFELVFANTPEEMRRLGRSVKYDLLLLDILFVKVTPDILGYAKNNRIPVIALSSEPNDARNQKLLKEGCCACYIRPIRQHLLLSCISYWMRQYVGEN